MRAVRFGALARGDVGARDHGAAFGTAQAFKRHFEPAGLGVAGLAAVDQAVIIGAVEHRAQRGQVIGGGAVALFGRARATLQVVLTREHAIEARWRRRIHRVAPRIVDLDDRAAAVDYRDLVVQRGEHRGVQTLDPLATRLGAPERGQVERVDHAAFIGGKPAMAEDHRHAPPIAQLELEFGVVEAFQQVAGVGFA